MEVFEETPILYSGCEGGYLGTSRNMYEKILEHQLQCICHGFSVDSDGSIIFLEKKSYHYGNCRERGH